MSDLENNNTENPKSDHSKTLSISGMFKNWYLDYASYVVLERAIPYLKDGLKPVQRRILHSMKELEDGRYNKVANLVGNTMKYHPHGDASIKDALVWIAQKELLIDMQGNWGNIFTGDTAAAGRYIEARLSKFALDVVFNPKITDWLPSYDGRNKEPIFLPIKFPLLLAQGAEGVAVTMACKILPHNFIELIDASIEILKGNDVSIFPDFPTGGLIDVSKYNDGKRGGKVRVRAKIEVLDKKTLVIRDIPFGTNTSKLIDNIISVNDKGKLKLRKIEDNTSDKVEILVHLLPNVSAENTIDALYAFTECEVSISPNICVIVEDKPQFLSATEILKLSTFNTLALLKKELELNKHELLEEIFYSSLEKIFIENRIYKLIEECKTIESIVATIDEGLTPFKKLFYREILQDDILKLTDIKILRTSRFDSFKADEKIKKLEEDLKVTENHLENLVVFGINYFKELKKKYGKGKERKTEITNFETIEIAKVAVINQKVYVNREEGFIGTGLKKEEFVCDCSDVDDIIVFRNDGKFIVTKVNEKTFVGKNIIHVALFNKNDEKTIYNMIYQDGPYGNIMVKRFFVGGITRDKEYDLTKGAEKSSVIHFSANANGETEVVTVYLKPRPKMKRLIFDFDFKDISVKGRSSQGNILSKYAVRKILLKGQNFSSTNSIELWFDFESKRLNIDKKGEYLGEFSKEDKIISFTQSGDYRTCGIEIGNYFDEDVILVEKIDTSTVFTAIYYDEESKTNYIKRFNAELTDKKTSFIGENNKLLFISSDEDPIVKVIYDDVNKAIEELKAVEFVTTKSIKTKGKKLTTNNLCKIELIETTPDDNIGIVNDDEEEKIDIEELLKKEEKKIDLDEDEKQMTLFDL